MTDLVNIIYHGTPDTVKRRQEAESTTPSPNKAHEDKTSSTVAMVELPEESYTAQEEQTELMAPQEDPTEWFASEEVPADTPSNMPVETSATEWPSADTAATTHDKMRALIARYAASSLDKLRQNAGFVKLLQDGGDFVVDLIMAVNKGPDIYN